MDSSADANVSILHQEAGARPSLPRFVTDDLQGRVNALAAALITQGYEPTLVRLRAGLGRTPQDILQRAFEYWKAHVRPKIGKAPERLSTWGNEVAVPDAIRDLFSETWRITLIAARMTTQFSDESLEKVTVSEETRAIRTNVDRLERLFAEHHEQRRIDAEIFRSLTMRLAQVCAQSEALHTQLAEKLARSEDAADKLRQKLVRVQRSIHFVQLEALGILAHRRTGLQAASSARGLRSKRAPRSITPRKRR